MVATQAGPPAARPGILQAGLVVAALVTVVALPLIARQGSQPPAKALLLTDYGENWLLPLGLVAGATQVAYAVRVARESNRSPAARDPAGAPGSR